MQGKFYTCPNRHTFDLAKEGYVNLLPVQKKKKIDPGDNQLMVKSREDFLSKGYFDDLAYFIADLVSKHNVQTLLDIGCGTGYYIRKIKERFSLQACGIDISKHAVKMAASKDKTSLYSVSSAFDLPFADRSFDVMLNIFAPKAGKEYARVLKDDGVLIEVVPSTEHLLELKEQLYSSVRVNEQKAPIEPFTLQESFTVKYKKIVETGEDLLNLSRMTPYWYKTEQSALDRLATLSNLPVTFDFSVRVWK